MTLNKLFRSSTSIILLISFLRSFFLSSLYIRFENERIFFSQCLYERSRNNLCIYILIHGCFICVRRTMNDEVIMNWINSFSSKYVLLWLSICFCKYVENFYLMDGMHFFPVFFFFWYIFGTIKIFILLTDWMSFPNILRIDRVIVKKECRKFTKVVQRFNFEIDI